MSLQVLLRASTYSGSGAWLDESGFTRNATLETGTIAKNVAGNGIVLNGSTGWTFPSPTGGLGNAWTTSVWYKNTGTKVTGSRPCVITQRVGTYINAYIGWAIDANTFSGGYYDGVGGWKIGTQITLTNNVWTNIQVTWDGTSVKTYINGTLLGTTTPGGIARNATGNLAYRIGRRWDSAEYMIGEIGEVRLYNYALNQTEVTTDYNASYSTFNLTVPTAPLIFLRPVVSNQTIDFVWQAPTSDGGSAITQYTLASAQDGSSPYTIASTERTYTVTGLSNSTQYTYTITATNGLGAGPSATFRKVQPGLRPIVPNTTATVTSATTATVAWTAADLSGTVSPLIGYSVITKQVGASPPYTNRGRPVGATSIDVSGIDLSNNAYVFRVSAVNDPNYSVALETNPIGNVQYTFTSPLSAYPTNGSAFTSVASSTNGQKIVLCAKTSGSIWTSADGGQAWLERTSAGSRNWDSVASSSNGTKLIAADASGSLWTSSDSGVTWTERPAAGPSPQAWSAVAISANGTYAVAAAGIPGIASGYIYKSGDSGATWTQTASPQRSDWTSLTVSDNGATLYATALEQYTAPIYKSTDSGATWNLIPFTGTSVAFYAIASSSDGTKLIIGDYAGGTGIWTSTDTGLNWTNNASYFQGQQIRYTGSVASSNSGTRLAVVANNSVWTSGDSGATWTEETTPTGTNLYIACDMSGTTLYAVGDGNGTTGMYIWKGLYTSSWAWTQTLISADLSGNTVSGFGCIACSKNGQYIYLAIINLPIWKSSNYGATWAEISGSPTIAFTGNAGITCSDDGSTVVVFQLTVHVSSDYGVTWNVNTPNYNSLAGAVRTTKIVVGGGDGYDGVYVSTDGGTTWTNPSDNDLYVSRALTMSLNGLVIAGAGGGVSASVDGGTNWYTDTIGGSWTNIRVSTDLTKLVVMNGLIFFSIDSGVSWKILLTAGLTAWTSIAVSADFTKMAATTNGGYIRYSTDSGATWADGTNSGSQAWTSIAGDSTGQYLVATVDGGTVWTSSDYGANWTSLTNSSGVSWLGAAISADGTTMVAGETVPWISNNGGTTWTQYSIYSAGTALNFSAFVSSNGAFIAVGVNGSNAQNIWTTSNSGSTWTEQTDSGAREWTAIAGSSDGSVMVALANNYYILVSNNSGATWVLKYALRDWRGAACSSTGQYMAATAYGGYILTSDDYGDEWFERETERNWTGIASDSTGAYLVALVSGGSIWTSADYGSTWIERTSAGTRAWQSVSCSSTGNNIIAGVSGGASLWVSSDFGATWVEQTGSASGEWFGVASSANARTIVAVRDSGSAIVIGNV
jgi:hypothetical protein